MTVSKLKKKLGIEEKPSEWLNDIVNFQVL